jgi:hypothetical protein
MGKNSQALQLADQVWVPWVRIPSAHSRTISHPTHQTFAWETNSY